MKNLLLFLFLIFFTVSCEKKQPKYTNDGMCGYTTSCSVMPLSVLFPTDYLPAEMDSVVFSWYEQNSGFTNLKGTHVFYTADTVNDARPGYVFNARVYSGYDYKFIVTALNKTYTITNVSDTNTYYEGTRPCNEPGLMPPCSVTVCCYTVGGGDYTLQAGNNDRNSGAYYTYRYLVLKK